MYKTNIIFFFALLICAVPVYADEVVQFAFTTDPQSVSPGTLSKEITIQSQNGSGQASPIGETFDLAFSSPSASGQFLNSSGNAVSTTMSKNTSNRTFYYKDTSTGDFILSVVATGRDSKRVFTATQHIYIGVDAPGTTGTTTQDTTKTDTQTTTGAPSAYSSPATISTTPLPSTFEVSSGRDRLVTVGNQVSFRATITKIQNVSEQSIGYDWSFGDGTTAQGKVVNHTYKFPGDYIIILNAHSNDVQAVSRTDIKVVQPVVVLTRVDGGLELKNTSKYEINLQGWKLRTKIRDFVFPDDTLVGVGKSITVPDDVTGVNGASVALVSPNEKVFATVVGNDGQADTVQSSLTPVDLSKVSLSIRSMQETLATIQTAEAQRSVVVNSTTPPPPIPRKSTTRVSVSFGVSSKNLTASAAHVLHATTSTSTPPRAVSQSWVSRSVYFLKHIFVSD